MAYRVATELCGMYNIDLRYIDFVSMSNDFKISKEDERVQLCLTIVRLLPPSLSLGGGDPLEHSAPLHAVMKDKQWCREGFIKSTKTCYLDKCLYSS